MLYLFYQEEMPNRLPLILFINLPLLRFAPTNLWLLLQLGSLFILLVGRA